MEFTIIDSWDLVKSEIIDKFILNKKGGNNQIILDNNSYKQLYTEINFKLKNRLYQNLNNDSIINTIKYVFWETRSGIFCSIKNNKLEAFIPFANSNYKNDWFNELTFYKVSPDSKNPVKDYLKNKKKILGFSREMNLNSKYWWANHHFLNVKSRSDVWGQHSLIEYYEMIQSTLKNHKTDNIMFVINKRDHPILRADLHKPYTFLYKKDIPLINHIKNSYAPIITSYSNDEYLDITIPIVQDWIIATNPEDYYPIINDVKWSDKLETAYFRGSTTGRLNKIDKIDSNDMIEFSNLYYKNQRIRLAKLSYEWSKDEQKMNLLDAGLTSWNLSDKIDSNGFVYYLIPKELENIGITLKKKVPMNEQIIYKYLINMDGHTAPNRTTWILKSGCLMLLVESYYNDKTWISNNLKPYKHYIPIKSDLSDLEEKIKWCKENDDECKKIVKQAKLFVDSYITKETITNYMSYLFNRISKNRMK